MVSDTRCARGGGGTGWFLTGFTGFTGLRDEGRNAKGAEITRRARREEETPIGGKATLTLRRGHGVSYLEGLAVTTRDSTCSGVFSLLLPVS